MTQHGSAPTRDTSFFGHPGGLSTLFFTEMWERFSYYGMRAILTLFMLAPVASGGLGMRPEQSGPIYAMYTSLVYLMSIPGGWLADNILGQRKSVLYGGIVIMTGHILLAMHGLGFFYSGLGCVILGTGLLKPNISAIVGQLYSQRDERRESGFSIFYMGINLGAFLAPLVCGALAQNETWRAQLESWGLDPANSWHWGFGAAAVGMALGLLQYVLSGRKLGTVGLEPPPAKSAREAAKRRSTLRIGIGVFLGIAAIVAAISLVRPALLNKDSIDLSYRVLLLLVIVGFFGHLFTAGQWTRGERNRLIVIVILFAAASVFWGVFEQAGSTLTIFADSSTENSLLGYDFASSWWQSLNAVLIVFLAPVFSWLWVALGKRNPSYGIKFALGLLFVALGFLWLVGGAAAFSDDWDVYVDTNRQAIASAATRYGVELDTTGDLAVSQVNQILAEAGKAGVTDVTTVLPSWRRVGVHWLFVVYLLHTIGELCLSPVGLAAMTRLSPARVVGQMMGVWFLAASIGNYLGGSVAGYYEKFRLPTLLTLVAVTTFVITAVMFALVRPINRMLAEAEAESEAGPDTT